MSPQASKALFIALSEALRTTRPHVVFIEARSQWALDRKAIADELALTNPLFSRERFYTWTDK